MVDFWDVGLQCVCVLLGYGCWLFKRRRERNNNKKKNKIFYINKVAKKKKFGMLGEL